MTTKPKSFTPEKLHTEQVVERHIVDQLVATQGYEERPSTAFDKTLGLDRDVVVAFLKDTQPEVWRTLEGQYPGAAEDEFFRNLEVALKGRGTLEVLRDGFKIVPNMHFRLMFPRPASSLNPDLVRAWQGNRLTVMTQVVYSKRHGNAIDIVLFLNGIPVATLEVKNTLTGQTFRHAEAQYRKDRSPAGEPLLTFKRGALVHFALDQEHVSMTTRLMNGKTRFLPFNRGRDGGAGNPDIEGDFAIGYLYADQPEGKAIFGREVWIDLMSKFIHLDKSDGKQKMLFPRFQQLDCVRKTLAHARTNGPGHNYLEQHSAGSGKSNTIAWLAHQAINLHDDQDKPIFDTAIIITDRLVLDRQLQATVASFEKTPGLVKKIGGTSRDLKAAIEAGARIIITTIQKFGTEHLAKLSGVNTRRFAIIIDEAHSSQSGKANADMVRSLTRSSEDVEDVILEYQRARGPQPNISFFAFTATPRPVTLERFGRIGPDGTPQAFHLYSMRQAIEEGFILDVLQNYTTYQAYFQLEKAIEDDPALRTRDGQRRVARFARLHPTNIAQKVEVIVEHFRRHVMHELGGEAKAMVVTESREHALRYWQGLKGYIEKHGYTDMKALVAFSGDLEVDGQTWTEEAANGFSEGELPKRFNGIKPDGTPYDVQYQVLVVAEKYQTGFDQPKLCAMYVDKKLDGLQAVQTLARLNRTHPGKDRTFILDFRNSVEDIRTAFAPFYEATLLEERTNLSQIYTLEAQLRASPAIDMMEIDEFAQGFFVGRDLTSAERTRLEAIVRRARDRFLLADDEAATEEFRQLAKSYMRFYAFVSQVIPLEDSNLESLYVYLDWLVRLLPSRAVPAQIEITDDMLRLEAYRIEKTDEGSASLAAGDGTRMQPIVEFGASPYTEEEEQSLSEIVSAFNDRHGTTFSREDFLRLEQVNREILEDDDLREMILNNPEDVVRPEFANLFMGAMIRMFQRDTEMKSAVMTDNEAREMAIRHFFRTARRQVFEEAQDRS
ncbi:type I restriction endonuclease subunit R [Ponticoccus gilvus]|nr:type I restriction endonuclease subunit R [Enemella evansiae]